MDAPSEEQAAIVEAAADKNIIVSAVAGSGKTTTILHVAKQYPDRKILLLTYNSRLKTETREKVKMLNLRNIDVHTFHSFGYQKYSETLCKTDKGIRLLLKEKKNHRIAPYDTIIVDEAQDLTPLLFEFLCKILKDVIRSPKNMIIIGDPRQSIFQYREADERYIVMADQVMPIKSAWTRLTLSTSYRVTREIAAFVNESMLEGEKVITAAKDGSPVDYIVCNIYGDRPYEEIMHFLDLGYRAEDIFVLAYSVKTEGSPVRALANRVASRGGIPVYIPFSDEEPPDVDVLTGKLVFSTFHQTKGLERKVVIIVGFDMSLFTYYIKKDPPKTCPNILYVACTRAKERLVLLHGNKHNYFPFFQYNPASTNMWVEQKLDIDRSTQASSNVITVTEMTRHLSDEVIAEVMELLTITDIQEPKEAIPIPDKVWHQSMCESVQDINGTAIPFYFQVNRRRMLCLEDSLLKKDSDFSRTVTSLSEMIDDVRDLCASHKEVDMEKILKLANYWMGCKAGLVYKILQIHSYDWLDRETAESCCDRLEEKIGRNAQFERQLQYEDPATGKMITGICDVLEKDKMWELKCKKELDVEDFIQVAIYQYLHRTAPNGFRYFLWNITDNTIKEVHGTRENLAHMIRILVDHRFRDPGRVEDDVFLDACKKISRRHRRENTLFAYYS